MSLTRALTVRTPRPLVAVPALSLERVMGLAIGGYLFVHFLTLLPFATELFSNQGMLPDAALSPLSRAFPNILAVWDTPFALRVLLTTALVASAMLALGVEKRVAALFLAYVWACLLGRNPLIRNPSIPFLGLMLITIALEPDSDDDAARDLRKRLRGAFLAVLALGYSYSALTKLPSASWISGHAFIALLDNPLARDTALRGWLLAGAPALSVVASYAVLALELGYAPLSLFPRMRLPLSLLMVAMHIGLVILVDFADLSLGMLLAHLFTWEEARAPWAEARPDGARPG